MENNVKLLFFSLIFHIYDIFCSHVYVEYISIIIFLYLLVELLKMNYVTLYIIIWNILIFLIDIKVDFVFLMIIN